MAVSESKKKANAKWNAKAYDTVLYRTKKGVKADITAHATLMEESVNGFISRAIDEAIARDNKKCKKREASQEEKNRAG